MRERTDYAPVLQAMEPPTGMVEWLQERGELKTEYLIYGQGKYFDGLEDREKTGVRVVCTHCGEAFFVAKVPGPGCSVYAPAPYGWYNHRTRAAVVSGEKTVCPECGAEAETYHVGNAGNGLYDWARVAQILRIPAEGKADRLAVLDWSVCRRANKAGQVTYDFFKRCAFVVEERKTVSLGGYAQIYYNGYFRPLKQREKFVNDFGEAEHIWPWDPDMLIGTTAENCKLDLYIEAGGKRLVDWLALWRKRPQAENLLVQGYGRAVAELLDAERASGIPAMPWFDWSQKRPARILGMTTEEFRAYRGALGGDDYRAYDWARKNGVELRRGLEDIRAVAGIGIYEAETLLEAAGARDFWRGLDYLGKQRRNAVLLRDYRRMARQLGYDMENTQVLWPRDLKKAHDDVAVLLNKTEDAKFDRRFAARAAELAKYGWESDGILIRPCASKWELRREGTALCHCVLSYAGQILEGKTAIFFVRRAEKPDEPWYTLELDEKTLTVRQNRGLRNCGRTPEVDAFEKAWVSWLRETFGKKNRNIAAGTAA